MEKNATLKLPDGKTIDFPVQSGSIGPQVIDIRTLYGKSGMFTYDPGFLSTASCSSAITYIDGDAGVLLYRGYPIEQLAQHCDFLEVCYLLLNGELPDKRQKDEFVGIVTHHTMVHEQLARLYQGFRPDAHPMAGMSSAVTSLPVVLAPADLVSDGAHDPQDEADGDEDETDGPEDRDAGDESDDEEDDSEDDHGDLRCSAPASVRFPG